MNYTPYIIHYVHSPAISAQFYTALLGQYPCETSPTFALFTLANGTKLGLWAKHTVEPSVTTTKVSGETALLVDAPHHVDELFAAWQTQGISIIQKPTLMEFGYTFAGVLPDGQRLRIFSLPKP